MFFERELRFFHENKAVPLIWPINSLKKYILIRRMQGFGVSAKAETCLFTVYQALFVIENRSQMQGNIVFSLGKCCSRSNFGVSGRAPEGLRSSSLSCFLMFLSLFVPCRGLENGPPEPPGKQDQNAPKMSPRSPRAKNEPQEAQKGTQAGC